MRGLGRLAADFFGRSHASDRRAKSRLAAAVSTTIERLEDRRLFYAPIPAGYALVGSPLVVDLDGDQVSSTAILGSGKNYLLIASGKVTRDLIVHDAEYRRNGNSFQDSDGSVDYGVALGSGVGINWGTYQADGFYSATVTGTGSTLSLKYIGGESSWTGSINVDLYAPLTQISAAPAIPRSGGGLLAGASGASATEEMSDPVSPSGVRYHDGSLSFESVDLQSDGFGRSFGQTRVWSSYRKDLIGSTGYGWTVSELPFLKQPSGSSGPLVLVNGDASTYYDPGVTAGTFGGRYYDPNRVSTSSTGDFVLKDGGGSTFTFHGFGSGLDVLQRGQLKSFTDLGGNVTTVTYDPVTYRISRVSRAFTPVSQPTITETWVYSHVASEPNAGLLSSVSFVRTVGTVPTPLPPAIRTVEYEYYNSTNDPNGGVGDLKQVVVKDGSNNTIESKYYRYLTTDAGGGNFVSTHLVKMAVEGRSFARADAAPTLPVPALMSDSSLATFADRTLTWSNTASGAVVTQAKVKGQGGTTGDGTGVYGYTYSTDLTNPESYNAWRFKTIEQVIDPSNASVVQSRTIYANVVGQVMGVKVQQGSSGSTWDYAFIYDDAGRMIMAASPSAMKDGDGNEPSGVGIDERYADLLNGPVASSEQDVLSVVSGNGYANLSDDSGLVTVYSYATSTSAGTWTGPSTDSGSVSGRLESVSEYRGEFGATAVELSRIEYTGVDTIVDSLNSADTYLPSKWTTLNSGGDRVRKLSFVSFFTGSALPSEVHEIVEVGGNGPSTMTTRTINNAFGRTQWYQDGDGFIDCFEYDVATGAQTLSKIDTVTSVPSGWQTNAAGGLTLTTTTRVDAFGRATKITDPANRLTFVVYNDVRHEVRTYAGWSGGLGADTKVVRDDWSNGYLEVLSMRVSPSVAGSEPNGNESVTATGLVSLARDYISPGGLATHSDRYFSQPSSYTTNVSMGSLNTHYYRTERQFNALGQVTDTTVPTGTIYRTGYDGLGRAISTFVGTTTLNLTQTSASVYDFGGVGDSLVTSVTNFLGGSQDARVTQYAYDWRDRLVGKKEGVQTGESTSDAVNRPLTVYQLNQIGDVEAVLVYDGDGLALSTSGVLNTFTNGSELSRTEYAYDKLGREYFKKIRWPGTPPASLVGADELATLTWYNNRDQVVKITPPSGPITKKQYDGAGRLVAVFATDGLRDSTYEDALTVGGTITSQESYTRGTADYVVEQTEYTYDGSGNVILETNRKRLHDAPRTGSGVVRGSLANAGSWARSSFIAKYYDSANRLTAEADYGTNGGAAFSRPTTVAARGNTVLVTSYSYNAQLYHPDFSYLPWGTITTNPRGFTSSRFSDIAGRTVATTEGETGFTANPNAFQTTLYRYNGIDQVVEMKAERGAGNSASTFAIVVDNSTTDIDSGQARRLGAGTLVIRNPNSGYGLNTVAAMFERQSSGLGQANDIRPAVFRIGDPGALSLPELSGLSLATGDIVVKMAFVGDVNLNGLTDEDDLALVASHVGQSSSYRWTFGDFDNDGDVDSTDLADTDYMLNQGVTFGAADVGYQVTEFIYGVVVGQGQSSSVPYSGASTVTSNDLLREIRHSDPVSGDSSWYNSYDQKYYGFAGQVEYFAYDAWGTRISTTDRSGTAHVYTYDVLGRMTEDQAGSFTVANSTVSYSGTLRTGVTDSVRRQSYEYDALGRLTRAASWSASTGGNVVNDVVRTYNGFGQLQKEYQATFGAVSTGSTSFVEYTYITPPPLGSQGSTGLEAYTPPLTRGALPFTIAYPDGRTIVYSYDDYLDQRMGRPTAIGDTVPFVSGADAEIQFGVVAPSPFSDPGTSAIPSSRYIEKYTYLGLSTVVERGRPDATVSSGVITITDATKLTYVDPNGSGNTRYSGLDRWSRIIGQKWVNSSGTAIDSYSYAYDRNSNPIGKTNDLVAGRGEKYTYDGLDRLTGVTRGTVSFSGSTTGYSGSTVSVTGSTPATVSGQSWRLDPLGNWENVSTTASGSTTTETRGHDLQNRLTARGGVLLAYDVNGNLLNDGAGTTYTYDAWNRLATAVKTGTGSYSKTFRYDALRRRVAEIDVSTSTGTALLYSKNWQVLEERALTGFNGTSAATGSVALAQNVWSTVYVDALAARDRDADSSTSTKGEGTTYSGTSPGSGLEERIYTQTDANFNVTSLVRDSDDSVVERYAYQPYGTAEILTGTWSARSATAYGNPYRFQGLRLDAATGLHHARWRDYADWLGRWTQQDPAGWPDGVGRMEFVRSSPLSLTDPSGNFAFSLAAGVDVALFIFHFSFDVEPWVAVGWRGFTSPTGGWQFPVGITGMIGISVTAEVGLGLVGVSTGAGPKVSDAMNTNEIKGTSFTSSALLPAFSLNGALGHSGGQGIISQFTNPLGPWVGGIQFGPFIGAPFGFYGGLGWTGGWP